MATCRHSWRDTPEGLVLRTQQWVGLMAPHASTSTYDTSLMAPVTNMVIREKYLDGATNVPKGNITAAGYMASLHFLQEVRAGARARIDADQRAPHHAALRCVPNPTLSPPPPRPAMPPVLPLHTVRLAADVAAKSLQQQCRAGVIAARALASRSTTR